MSDNSSKPPSIPAWQRAQQPLKPETDASQSEQQARDTDAEDGDAPGPEDSTPQNGSQDEQTEEKASHEPPLSADERAQQLEIVKAFLDDPGVKDEPIEKKRAFLESKGVTTEMIDQELGSASSSTFNTSDFASFKQTSQPPVAPQPPRAPAPPIITYPEFLEDARKPPPLITPTRILNATYLASGLAALAYGASTFLIKPMAANLTDARHDFASHNQTKIDEFNDRLSKLVSKIPEPKKSSEDAADSSSSDTESVASDPTELFHRDIGTQTSPAITPPPTSTNLSPNPPTDKQHERLSIINSHLSQLLTGLEAGAQPAKDRLDETNRLRHALDNMMYRVQTANAWGSFGAAGEQKAGGETEDAVEELKREIRGVKGVLLSAKRFAPVGTVSGRAGS
ncbi:hypothetical protein WHR41_06600 [Cladosporium halotolerans]|uniref:Peroxisomal membrane protein PEX14 n=1 Tax=Cladosporium halotolerans TaxID=1052096 RepID=A0AB34KL70_9PEZI